MWGTYLNIYKCEIIDYFVGADWKQQQTVLCIITSEKIIMKKILFFSFNIL